MITIEMFFGGRKKKTNNIDMADEVLSSGGKAKPGENVMVIF